MEDLFTKAGLRAANNKILEATKDTGIQIRREEYKMLENRITTLQMIVDESSDRQCVLKEELYKYCEKVRKNVKP